MDRNSEGAYPIGGRYVPEQPMQSSVERHGEEAQKQVWDRLWSQKINYHWDPLSESIFECICETIGAPSSKKMLEAGSGTGKISLRLAMDGAFVTLVDYSRNALEQSGLAFRQKDCIGEFVLADIRSIAPPATFSFYAGTDAVRFITQYEQYGLKDTIRLTGSGFMLEGDTLPAQGKSALGALNCLHYADTLEHAENQKFVAAYREAHGEYPSVYAEYGYVAAKVIHQAVEAVDGNASDKDKLREAMRAVKFMAPRGPFAFNQQTQGPVHNIYVREVAEIDGRITNKVIQTIEGVTDPDKMPT